MAGLKAWIDLNINNDMPSPAVDPDSVAGLNAPLGCIGRVNLCIGALWMQNGVKNFPGSWGKER